MNLEFWPMTLPDRVGVLLARAPKRPGRIAKVPQRTKDVDLVRRAALEILTSCRQFERAARPEDKGIALQRIASFSDDLCDCLRELAAVHGGSR